MTKAQFVSIADLYLKVLRDPFVSGRFIFVTKGLWKGFFDHYCLLRWMNKAQVPFVRANAVLSKMLM